ncbi:MAG: hypothetical protein AB8B73_11780 [Ekhidna sp.]
MNTPIFKEKSEFQAAVYTGTAGFDTQVAYAATDNLGFMMNGSFEFDSESKFLENYFLELGTGYFEKMGAKGVVEFYGGAGFGSIERLSPDVNSFRAFIQPALGWSFKTVELSIAHRVVYVNVNQNSISKSAVFFEPAFTVKGGFKNVKLVMQGGISLHAIPEDIEFDYEPLMISLGIQARLNKKKDTRTP